MEDEQDHRVRDDICGVTEIWGGTEFICIRPPHAAVYTRNTSDRTHTKGDLIFSAAPQGDRHHFVNRWPNRKKES